MPAKLPEHTRRVPSDRQAKAPYNFVPLPEAVVTVDDVPDHDNYYPEPKRYTGYLVCTLKTLTPFYTRCMMTPEFFREHGDKKFEDLSEAQQNERAKPFNLLEVPVIPGSSLRGMTRNLVEIAAYGKVAWITDKQLIYRAVGDPSSLGDQYRERLLGRNKAAGNNVHLDYPGRQVRGGYLKKYQGGWAIQPAVEHYGESFIHVDYSLANKITGREGKQKVYNDVYVLPAPRQSSPRPGLRFGKNLILDLADTKRIETSQVAVNLVRATLVESGHMSGKNPKHWHCAIYELNPQARPIPISQKKWEIYQNDKEATGRKLNQEGDPLFYLIDDQGDLIYFGHTMMFRLPYDHKPDDLIPSEIYADKLRSLTDFAEAIFGYTEGDGEQRLFAYAGRVSFEDAHFVSGTAGGTWQEEQPITPQILSGPKPTTFQHYLTQSDAGAQDKKNLNHYASDPRKTTIRGHKLYWHKGQIRTDNIIERDQEKIRKAKSQYTRIQPVKPGVTFRFNIHFENLSQAELGALLWVLDLPDGHHHKLGMGKPLGLGSVAIKPELYLGDRSERYRSLFDEQGSWATGSTEQPENPKPFKTAFEQAIIASLKQQGVDAATNSFTGLERIQTLLKLLEWEGPSRDLTRYMVIPTDRGGVNEFKDRKVLPHPLDIERSATTGSPTETRTRPHRSSPPPNIRRTTSVSSTLDVSTAQRRTVASPPQQNVSTPQVTSTPLQVGDVFTGTVESIWSDGTVIVQYKNRPIKEVRGVIDPANLAGKHFAEGKPARCQVIKITKQAETWILECKPGPRKGKEG